MLSSTVPFLVGVNTSKENFKKSFKRKIKKKRNCITVYLDEEQEIFELSEDFEAEIPVPKFGGKVKKIEKIYVKIQNDAISRFDTLPRDTKEEEIKRSFVLLAMSVKRLLCEILNKMSKNRMDIESIVIVLFNQFLGEYDE